MFILQALMNFQMINTTAFFRDGIYIKGIDRFNYGFI
jgi:hypothetical protein